MKKFIIAAMAASVLATPVLAAPYDNHDNRGRIEQRRDNDRHDRRDYRQDKRAAQRYEYRQWKKGQRFDYRYARNYRVIGSPYAYHLRPAPHGYRWVQSGNDAVMIGITTGLIASVIAGAIH